MVSNRSASPFKKYAQIITIARYNAKHKVTHTDESSTCLSGIVRGSGIASHRPQFKPFYLEHGPSVVDLHGDERSS